MNTRNTLIVLTLALMVLFATACGGERDGHAHTQANLAGQSPTAPATETAAPSPTPVPPTPVPPTAALPPYRPRRRPSSR